MTTGRLVDLTVPIRPGMPVYPGDPEVATTAHATADAGGFAVTRLALGSHSGTHVDAARHVDPAGPGVDRLDLHALVGPALVLDVAVRPHGTITAAALPVAVDDLPAGSRLLLRTGWSRRAGRDDYFAAAPGLDPDLAHRLAAVGVVLVGVEQPSVDAPGVRAVHTTLLRADVAVVESLRSLDDLTADEVMLMCLPLALVDGDGAPVRAVAWEPA